MNDIQPAIDRSSLLRIQSDWILPALIGLLWTSCFPRWSLGGLAWLVPAFLFLASLDERPRRCFRIAWFAGLVHQLTTLYWLLNIPYAFTPILGWIAMAAYLACFPAAWCWMLSRTLHGPSPCQSPWNALLLMGPGQRLRFGLMAAVFWVGLEKCQMHFLTGFPWLFLGTSQFSVKPIVQSAAWWGVAGISLVVVWISFSLMFALLAIRKSPGKHWLWLQDLAIPGVAVILLFVAGMGRVTSRPEAEKVLKIALVQPSIPQTVKWDEAANEKAFSKVLDLSRLALSTRPDLLVWPEAVTPGLLRFDRKLYEEVTGLAEQEKVWILLGADDAETIPENAGQPDKPQVRYFNSVFSVSPKGVIEETYRKQRLVMFGEYIPLVNALPFLKWFSPVGSGFTPGTAAGDFTFSEPDFKATTLICFEDAFPLLARAAVTAETDLIINLTNDGWFGESAAQWQHAVTAAFRAVENGIPLVRSTNNGLTCWVDAHGNVHEVYFGDSEDVYAAGFKVATIPLRRTPRTLFHRYGDWLGTCCFLMTFLHLAFNMVQEIRARRNRMPKA